MGIEPMISWMKTKCPRPLDDGAKIVNLRGGPGGARTHNRFLKRELLYH